MSSPTSNPKPEPKPPVWADRFLRWFCAPELLEEVQGDLYEDFHRDLKTLGREKANRRFVKGVLLFFNLSTIRGNRSLIPSLPSFVMWKNYLKIAFRNLIREKGYSLINIVGLSLGLACFILLYLYSQHELSFDRFHSKSDRIYRLLQEVNDPDQGMRTFPYTPGPTGESLVSDLPEFESAIYMLQFGQAVSTISDTVNDKVERFNERNYLLVQDNFFEIFDFEMIEGDPRTALKMPNSVVLTSATAKKYFGNEDPMGKLVQFNRAGDLIVNGIVEDPPTNSHLDFDLLVSMNINMNERFRQVLSSWENSVVNTYVVAKKPLELEIMEAKIEAFAQQHQPEEPIESKMVLQALHDIHFESEQVESEILSIEESKSSRIYIIVFGIVSLFLLLIGCINYVNLATARSVKRSREIGIRKVVGANKSQLITQFLCESVLTALISMSLAVMLAWFTLPYFNSIANKELSLDLFNNINLVLALSGVALLVGLLSGIFPAFLLSGFRIVNILKGTLVSGGGGNRLRKVLVVAQFSCTVIILISTIVVYQQLNYIQTRDLGFDKDQLVVIDINSGAARGSFQAMKSAFKKHSNVTEVSATSRVPGEWKNIAEISIKPQSAGVVDSLTTSFFCFDEDALETFGMELVEGNNFSGNVATDSAYVLINETAASMLGWEQPVGKFMTLDRANYPFQVIGVVKDFNFRSLHQAISPVVIGFWANPVQAIDYFSCKIKSQDISESLAHIESVQKQFDPTTPLEYHFLDQQIELFYQEETRAGKIFAASTLLTILIACMGLFGLVAFSVARRTREMGIRKILGASPGQLFKLLSGEVVVLIVISLFIAFPFSWWAVSSWLENFSFHVGVNWQIFVFAAFAVILLAMLTISYHMLRLTRTNPADTLRYE